MTRFYKTLGLVALLLNSANSFSQELIKVKLQNQYFPTFLNVRITAPFKIFLDFDDYKNYPQKPKMWLGKLHFQKEQFWYNESKKNTSTAEFYQDLLLKNNIDTSNLSDNEIKCYVGVFVGISGTKKTIIVDANNNHDFKDDMLSEYDMTDIGAYNDEFKNRLPVFKVEYQYYDKKIFDKVEYLQISPADNAYNYENPEEIDKAVYFIAFNNNHGTFNVGTEKYKIMVSNLYRWPIHTLNEVYYTVKKISESHNSKDLYKYNQSIQIENHTFEVIEYDFANDYITLRITEK
ncbi:MAG: hypothetical protein ACK4NY_18705 [Spirosomataceae bacterium]